MRKGEVCYKPPFPGVMPLWDNPKPINVEGGSLGESARGLTFSHGKTPPGGSWLPLGGAVLLRVS